MCKKREIWEEGVKGDYILVDLAVELFILERAKQLEHVCLEIGFPHSCKEICELRHLFHVGKHNGDNVPNDGSESSARVGHKRIPKYVLRRLREFMIDGRSKVSCYLE